MNACYLGEYLLLIYRTTIFTRPHRCVVYLIGDVIVFWLLLGVFAAFIVYIAVFLYRFVCYIYLNSYSVWLVRFI